jgi:hypothetical protein
MDYRLPFDDQAHYAQTTSFERGRAGALIKTDDAVLKKTNALPPKHFSHGTSEGEKQK